MRMDGETLVAIVGVVATILPVLVAHERRLTRIEGKIDAIMEMLKDGKRR